jgi:hypothetical protein
MGARTRLPLRGSASTQLGLQALVVVRELVPPRRLRSCRTRGEVGGFTPGAVVVDAASQSPARAIPELAVRRGDRDGTLTVRPREVSRADLDVCAGNSGLAAMTVGRRDVV